MNRVALIGDANNVHVQRWSAAMRLEGFDLQVISVCSLNHLSAAVYEAKNVPVHVVQGFPIYVRKMTTLLQIFQINRLLHRLSPDLVHIHFLSASALGATVFRSWKLLVSIWGMDLVKDDGAIFSSVGSRWRHFILNDAEGISVTSDFLAARTGQYLKGDKTDIIVIPFGVEIDKFHPDERIVLPSNGLVLGFVKHLEPKYGLSTLIKAIALLHDRFPELSLQIVGKGSLEAQLKHQVADLGLEQVVMFLGAISHEDVPKFLNHIDIFVMPSISESETFGVAAVEASAMEIPVIATSVGGVSEVVLHNQTGLLVVPGDIGLLARAIETLVLNKDLRLAMGRTGRSFVQQKYRWVDNVRQMKKLYEEILDR